MSTRHETSVLLTEIEEDYSPRTASARRRAPSWTRAMVDPGDDHARQRLAALTGRPVEFCCACGRPTGDHARQAASGKTYCASCAERTVAAYDARHPEVLAAGGGGGAPPAPAPPPRHPPWAGPRAAAAPPHGNGPVPATSPSASATPSAFTRATPAGRSPTPRRAAGPRGGTGRRAGPRPSRPR